MVRHRVEFLRKTEREKYREIEDLSERGRWVHRERGKDGYRGR